MLALFLLGLVGWVEDDLAKERGQFVGDWMIVETIKDGEVVKEALGGKTVLSFKADGTYLGLVGESVIGKGTYQPVPGTKPAAVDWTAAGRQEYDGKFTKEYPSVGIYRFEGDILTLVLKREAPASERPGSFECKPGSGWYLLRLKKVKK